MIERAFYQVDGEWACLGCGYTLYPGPIQPGYCANVRCPIRGRGYVTQNEDNVRRLLDIVLKLQADNERLREEKTAWEEQANRLVKDG